MFVDAGGILFSYRCDDRGASFEVRNHRLNRGRAVLMRRDGSREISTDCRHSLTCLISCYTGNRRRSTGTQLCMPTNLQLVQDPLDPDSRAATHSADSDTSQQEKLAAAAS
jgi:hypothetical protein